MPRVAIVFVLVIMVAANPCVPVRMLRDRGRLTISTSVLAGAASTAMHALLAPGPLVSRFSFGLLLF
jgi:hypothetical protein